MNKHELIINDAIISGKINWDFTSKHIKLLSNSFIEKYKNELNWDLISNQFLSEEFLDYFGNELNWKIILSHYIEKYINNENFLNYFIKKYQYKLKLKSISINIDYNFNEFEWEKNIKISYK